GRQVTDVRSRVAAPVAIPHGRWPLWQESGLSRRCGYVCGRDRAGSDPVRDVRLATASADHREGLPVEGGSALKTRGGGPEQPTDHGGDGGGAPARVPLVSPQGVRRDQGADRVCVCPSTGNAV